MALEVYVHTCMHALRDTSCSELSGALDTADRAQHAPHAHNGTTLYAERTDSGESPGV
eukprot:COSAG06_NODE_1215_length_10233_cov_68.717979_5_plen_58_part_00